MSGQATLEYLEHANLFIVPLDNERRWYRYHHLFRDLLRKRLRQSHTAEEIAKLHIRASQWYEDNALEIEAFHHAVDANDIDRAERLMEGKGIPLHFRGALNDILVWLASLPVSVLDAKPLLQVRSATIALMAGQTTSVEEKIQAAENALEKVALDAQNRDLIGQLACARATLAVTRYQPEEIIIQARRALGYLLPENMRFRFTANWALAVAYHLQGNRSASMQSITEALSISQISASKFSLILATTHLGRLQELENWLYQAAETYQRALQLLSNQPLPSAHDAHLGLARIYYEWNDLDAASRYAQQSLQMAHQYDQVIDRYILSEIFIARITLATGDAAGAAALLTQTRQSANHKNFTRWLAEIAAVQVLTLIRQGQLTAAAELSQQYELPMSLARVLLAQRNTSAALVILESFHQQMEAKGWQDERLKALVLLAIAHHAHSDQEKAVDLLSDALTLAEPGGFIRLFVDEGESVRLLLCDSKDSILKTSPNLCAYLEKLLAAFPSTAIEDPKSKTQNLVDPLSSRELEVLQLIAQGFSNQEICKRLFLALDTVKGHNRRIFEKLQVKRRTEAIARARELGLL
jgi:LuxR family maltose regulon positive regulatory protein